MREYKDSCRTYIILLQDSGLLPKPKEDWNTFTPKELDVAWVDENQKEFVYHNGYWQELTEELEKQLFPEKEGE